MVLALYLGWGDRDGDLCDIVKRFARMIAVDIEKRFLLQAFLFPDD